MKTNFTSINVLIDASGSMDHLATDTIEGFNAFLKTQKEVPGDAVLSLWTFDNNRKVVHEFMNLHDVPDLNKETYQIGGTTALLDAIGTSMNDIGAKLESMSEEDRPSKVIFLIITDAHANDSQKFHKAQVKDMVKHQTEKYNWDFVFIFMGANIDSIAEADAIGVTKGNTINYSATSVGTKAIYSDIGESMTRYRLNSNTESFFSPDNGGK